MSQDKKPKKEVDLEEALRAITDSLARSMYSVGIESEKVLLDIGDIVFGRTGGIPDGEVCQVGYGKPFFNLPFLPHLLQPPAGGGITRVNRQNLSPVSFRFSQPLGIIRNFGEKTESDRVGRMDVEGLQQDFPGTGIRLFSV